MLGMASGIADGVWWLIATGVLVGGGAVVFALVTQANERKRRQAIRQRQREARRRL